MSYDTLAQQEQITTATTNLEKNNIHGLVVSSGAEALAKIKEMIPAGASVMNGSSVTLESIGFVDYLKAGQHGWNNLHETILREEDKTKQAELRKQAALSDYYLGSVHALSETGEFLIASNTGSQLPHIVFTSKNLIFVVGAQKIVPNLAEGFKRLEEYVVPLEDKHMIEKYGYGTSLNKIVIFKKENPKMGRNVTVIIVNEKLGF
ncbi:MAG TPA: lactate utilization protein [Candidatus Andersenbacteria bacterium]|nr:lactate utilization protein [Candidatus Andersenbacteria bacterium]